VGQPIIKLERLKEKRVDRDWLNATFPCMSACPAGTNAGRYVALIAEGRFEEAYRYARDPNPMASVCGRVCAHPCETACRRGAIDRPISIRALKRFLTERYGPEARRPLEPSTCRVPNLGYRVAIIGSGPVGLSAAHDLALLGYSVTIFEAAAVAGGMLRLGIPEYRLPRAVVDAQIREILGAGDVTLKLNAAAGRDFSVAELRRSFQAVVLAVGAHRSRDLSIPGVDLDGVHKGIDFLLNANLGYRFSIGSKVVVIGGGNVAMDVARSAIREVVRQHHPDFEGAAPSEANIAAVAGHEMVDVALSALRLGAQEVSIVCLERRGEMPAAAEEIEQAEIEGVRLQDGRGPKRVVGSGGKVIGLETVKTKWVFDAEGRFNPAFDEHSESVIECDTVILAIGQAPSLTFLTADDHVDISARGLIVADRRTLMTSAPGIFAGGDCVFGPRLIIDSVGDGKRIAAGIDEYLTGRRRPEPDVEVELLTRHRMVPDFLDFDRQAVPLMPIDRRTGITEVELVYDEETARREARRCLHCWVNTVFEGNEPDGSQCILCGGCVDVCPEQCLQLVSLDRIEFPQPVRDQIRRDEGLYRAELDDVAATEVGAIAGSAMLKDETRCIRCGLCADRCPTGVITMEAYTLRPRPDPDRLSAATPAVRPAHPSAPGAPFSPVQE
jgi:NADPH-dependent glutamate synthase beta subunit-like oxidoreductase/NAD-dependent dihydropyrimidine dehydrogenase PreA subunit